MVLVGNATQPLVPIEAIAYWAYPVITAFVLVWIFTSVVGAVAFHRNGKGHEWSQEEFRLWHPLWDMSPKVLLFSRSLSFLVVIGVQLAYIGWAEREQGVFEYWKYTSWNWGLLAVYFALAVGLTGREILAHNSDETYDQEIFDLEMGLLGNIILLLYEIILPSVFVVCFTYWIILMPGAIIFGYPTDENFFSVAHHTINFAVVMIEFTLNRIPMHLGHIWIFLLWPGAFCLFTLVFYGYRERWPYPIMNARVALGLAWYSALWVANCVAYLGCYFLSKLKQTCAGISEENNPDTTTRLLVN